MNPLFADGLFDAPWITLLLVLGGMFINWLAELRKKKQAEQPPAEKPSGQFNLEQILRRVLEGEPTEQRPVPPPIPRPPQEGLPPVAGEPAQPFRRSVPPPPPRPPLIPASSARGTTTAVSELRAEVARHFEPANELSHQPAPVVTHRVAARPRVGKRVVSRWRDPRSARQAFVASIVFAPPKSLEP